eukprot:jgi/Tetstr1/432237/TSEL_002273.t1
MIVKLKTSTMRVKDDELRRLRVQVKERRNITHNRSRSWRRSSAVRFVARSRATTAEEKLPLASEKAEAERKKHAERVREMEGQAAALSRVQDRLREGNNLTTEDAADRSFELAVACPTAKSRDATTVRLPQVDGRKQIARTKVASLMEHEATYVGEFIKARAMWFQEGVTRLFGRGNEEVHIYIFHIMLPPFG